MLLVVAGLHAEDGVRFTATSANVSGAGETIRINLTEWSPDSRRDEFVAAWTLTAPAAQGRGGRGGTGRGGAGGRGAGGAGGRGAAGAAPRGARGDDATAVPPPPTAATDLPPDPDAVDPVPARGRGGARGGGGGGGNGPTQTPEGSLSAAIKKAPTVGILWTSENVGYSIKYAYRLSQPDGGERIILATDRRVGAWSNLWKPSPSITLSDYAFSMIELRLNSKGEGEGRGVVTGKVAIDESAKTISLDQYAALPVILKGVKRQTGN